MRTISAYLGLLIFTSMPAWGETSEERRTKAEAELAAIKAEIALQAARYSAYKDVFGTTPAVGMEGTVTIADATTGNLLRNKAGSLLVTKSLAVQLCSALRTADVKGAFIAPTDLDTKMQSSQFIVNELDYLHTEVSRQPTLASAAGLLAGLSVAKYGIDGIADALKLLRNNVEVGLSSTDRSGWLGYFVSAVCPGVLPVAHTETVTRTKIASNAIGKLNTIVKYADDFDRITAVTAEAIAREEKSLAAELAKDKPDSGKVAISKDQIDSQRKALGDMNVNKGLVTRIKALNTLVSSKPGEFLDAMMWNEYRLAPYVDAPRLVLSLATQDAQLVKTNYFLGKRIYGQSSGELIYRVVSVDGKTKIAGFLTATETLGKVDFDANEAMRCAVLSDNSNATSNCVSSRE